MALDHLNIIITKLPEDFWNWKKISIEVAQKNIDVIKDHPDRPWNWKKLSYLEPFPMELLEKYPNKSWDWYVLSSDKNLSINFVEKYIDKDWNWEFFSKKSYFYLYLLDKYPNKSWDWKEFSSKDDISVEIIEKYLDKPWDWKYLLRDKNLPKYLWEEKLSEIVVLTSEYKKSQLLSFCSMNPYLPMDLVEKYNKEPWNWKTLSSHINLSMELVMKYPHKEWIWGLIMKNPNFNLDVTIKFPYGLKKNSMGNYVGWNWRKIMKNPTFTIEKFIEYLPFFPDVDFENSCYDWETITEHPDITMELIEKYPNKSWDWYAIVNKPDFSLDVINKFPDGEFSLGKMDGYRGRWCWKTLLRVKNIENVVEKYKELYGNIPRIFWEWISESERLTMEIIEKYIDMPLNWSLISRNENLTSSFILKYKDKPWDKTKLIKNKFRNFNSAIKIQRFYRRNGGFFQVEKKNKTS